MCVCVNYVWVCVRVCPCMRDGCVRDGCVRVLKRKGKKGETEGREREK